MPLPASLRAVADEDDLVLDGHAHSLSQAALQLGFEVLDPVEV